LDYTDYEGGLHRFYVMITPIFHDDCTDSNLRERFIEKPIGEIKSQSV